MDQRLTPVHSRGTSLAMAGIMREIVAVPVALSLLAIAAMPGVCQTNSMPVISGVVNSASYTSLIGPGSIVSIFGSNLTTGFQSVEASSVPLPMTLAGTTVTFNGNKAPLLFVSPGQINAQIPSSTAVNGALASTASVVVSTAAGSSAAAQVTVFAVGPGFFSSDSSGCGAAAALNVPADGEVSANSPSNSAAPGDYISLFGTGLGVPTAVPADGHAVATGDVFQQPGLIHVDYSGSAADPSYSGLAPTLVGVDQVNFQIPPDTREGCSVPVSMDTGLPSQVVTISIGKTRGQCVDPPVQSYGEVWLERTIASGTANDGETDQFNAVFPASPGLTMPSLSGMSPELNTIDFATHVRSIKACAIPGYTRLSAGTISIQPSGQTKAATAAPMVQTTGGVEYRQTLPAGFVQAGTYMISSEANASTAVVFEQPLSVGAGISIETSLTPGTTLDAYTSRIISWTGGDPASLVRITLIDDANLIASPQEVLYASAGDGSVTMASCIGDNPLFGSVCSFGLPPSKSAQLIIDVLPAGGVADTVADVLGISQQVRFSWAWHYVFGGLSISY